jgi:hypothetical protein
MQMQNKEMPESNRPSEDEVRSQFIPVGLERAYAEMAADCACESEALERSEALLADAADR